MISKDVFLSHGHEDKAAFVYPLVKSLNNYSVSYWLDEVEIGWGDSIIGRINEGLSSSHFVLVLLTDAFLRKKWTIAELETALSAEISSHKITVLPIMATESENIFKLFPLLRRKLFLNWLEGPDRIAIKLLKLLKREFKSEWIISHPSNFSGKVWVQVLKQEKNINRAHKIIVRWGPWQYKATIPSDPNISFTLVHAKGGDGLSIPIFFDIDPPCFVKFGQDEPIGEKIIDINYGWKRMKNR
jgi:hypothetical protein